jgi:hypothetical protein
MSRSSVRVIIPSSTVHLARRWTRLLSQPSLRRAAHTLAPALFALSLAGVAHAQGTIDFSGAQTLMGSIKTFCVYAGAIVCFCGLVFAGIRMMSGNITQAIMGLGGAIVGAGVLGWGAGWISSLTGQSVS